MSESNAVPMSVSLAGVVLDSVDPRALARFYCRLLGWEIDQDEEEWVTVRAPGGGTHLSFQAEPEYQPPTWPSDRRHQQMMLHLDFAVDDLEAAHAHALSVGAIPAPWQPQQKVVVYTDPAGHPFCFFGPGG
jgi:catechol 2,3-dioxygenase-like lactoylglutathione lyase family enzyme